MTRGPTVPGKAGTDTQAHVAGAALVAFLWASREFAEGTPPIRATEANVSVSVPRPLAVIVVVTCRPTESDVAHTHAVLAFAVLAAIGAGHVEAIVTGPPTVADARAELIVADPVDAVLLAYDPRAVLLCVLSRQQSLLSNV